MRHTFTTSGVCAKTISFNLENDIVKNVEFIGGCSGNLKAISNLIEGQSVDYLTKKFSGVTCGSRKTSCVDQLIKGIQEVQAKQNAV